MITLHLRPDNRIWCLLLIVAMVGSPRRAGATALDDYVSAPDANYAYNLVNTTSGFGYKAYVLKMTSQAWRSSAEVDRTLWKHWLTIIVPTIVSGDTSLLVIIGGRASAH